MPRFVKSLVALFGAAGLVFLVPSTLRASARVEANAPAPTAVSSDVQGAMIRAGLDAEALAAVGVTTAQLGACVSAVAEDPAATVSTLAQVDGAFAAARAAHDALERKVQSGLASESEVAQLATAQQTLASATAARDAAIDAIHAAGAAPLTAGQRTTLAAIRANRSWSLPVEFLTVNRTEAEWVALRKALANERIAAKNGTTPNAQCQALLATERARTEIAAAKTARDANFTTLKAAFDAIGQ